MWGKEAGECMARRWMLLTASLFVLVGCGPGYRVAFQSEFSITYWYAPGRQSIVTVQHHAQEYCGQYGKDAVPQAFFDGYSGNDISFICTTSG